LTIRIEVRIISLGVIIIVLGLRYEKEWKINAICECIKLYSFDNKHFEVFN